MTTMMPNFVAFLFFTVFLFFALNARHYQARAFITSRPPTVTPIRIPPSATAHSTHKTTATHLNTISSTILASADFFEESDYVKKVENHLIELSQIHDDDTRRTNFEQFVTHRLQEELLVLTSSSGSSTATATARTPTDHHLLRGLDFVKAMDTSILKLGLSAQEQGWNKHVTSGFQQDDTNNIWPYVDMLIQFKILLSNIERTNAAKRRTSSDHTTALQKKSLRTTAIESYIDDIVGGGRRSSSSRRRSTALAATASSTSSTTPATTMEVAAATGNTSNGCTCNGCPGLNPCKDGKKKSSNTNKTP